MKLLTTARFSAADLESLKVVAPGLEVVVELDRDLAKDQFRDADIFCGFDLPGPISDAPQLKWIQLVSAGVEHILHRGILDSSVLVTTASGIHVHAISEYVLCCMVMLSRQIPQVLKETSAHSWRPRRARAYYGEELFGKTVGILGMGAIGTRVAEVCRCIGMEVLGLRRTSSDAKSDVMFTPDRLTEMLPRCDFVIVALPVTAETRGIVGEPQFRAMKTSAYLINVARGEIVEEAALVRALREGWIAGAALDVFTQEPLPPESEMWEVPNLIITPHMSGNFLAYLDRVMDILRENLRRFVAGEPMINVLDKQRGY